MPVVTLCGVCEVVEFDGQAWSKPDPTQGIQRTPAVRGLEAHDQIEVSRGSQVSVQQHSETVDDDISRVGVGQCLEDLANLECHLNAMG